MSRVLLAILIFVLAPLLIASPASSELVSFTMSGTVQNATGAPLGLSNGDSVVMTGTFDDDLFVDALNPDVCFDDNVDCPVNWNSGNAGQPWALTFDGSVVIDASMDNDSGFPGIVYTAGIPQNVELDFAEGTNGSPFTSGFGCSGGFVSEICTITGNDVGGAASFDFTLDRTTYVATPVSPPALIELGAFDTPGPAVDVAIAGDLAYVADSDGGLRIIDVSAPTSPVEVGSFATGGTGDTIGVDVSGTIAVILDTVEGLVVVDVSSPGSPIELGSVSGFASSLQVGFRGTVEIQGTLAFVAAHFLGLVIVDLSDPTQPSQLSTFPLNNTTTYGLDVVGEHVYVAAAGAGLRVIDVSNPAAPTEIGSVVPPLSAAFDVAVSGQTAYLSTNDSTVRVIDVSNPVLPNEIGFISTGELPFAVATAGSRVFVADGLEGLRRIDAPSPAAPVFVDALDFVDSRDVEVSRSLAFVADWTAGLRIVAFAPPTPSEPILAFDFDEAGNAPGSHGTARRPLKMRNDVGTALDFHSADGEGVSGQHGDRAFANLGASDHGSAASSGTNGFRADQSDADEIDGLSAFTISGWFKTQSTSTLQGKTPRLVNNHDGGIGAAGDGFNLQFFSGSDGDLKLEVDDDTGGGVNTTGTPYSAKQTWVFFAVSYDGTQTSNNVRFYRGFRNDLEAGGGVDSSAVMLVGTASLDRGAVDGEATGLQIGNRPGANRPFDGWLDEIRIDGFALDPSEAIPALEGFRRDAVGERDPWRIELADTANLPTSAPNQNATVVSVHELSGVTYDASANRFWAVADSFGRLLGIDASFDSNGGFASITAPAAISLDQAGDFEGIGFTNPLRDSVFISNEDGAGIDEYDLSSGNFTLSVGVPSVFPNNERPNRSFESLSLRPDGGKMWAGVEQALTIDGPDGTSNTTSTISRWQQFSVDGGTVLDEEQYAYPVEPVHGTTVNGVGSGLGDLLVLPDGLMLSLERSEADGEFLTRIFLTEIAGATDVSQGSLASGVVGESFTPPTKRLLFSDDRLGKVEGIALGPRLADGGYTVLAVEDDNSINTVHAFKLHTVPEPGLMVGLAGGVMALAALRRRRR